MVLLSTIAVRVACMLLSAARVHGQVDAFLFDDADCPNSTDGQGCDDIEFGQCCGSTTGGLFSSCLTNMDGDPLDTEIFATSDVTMPCSIHVTRHFKCASVTNPPFSISGCQGTLPATKRSASVAKCREPNFFFASVNGTRYTLDLNSTVYTTYKLLPAGSHREAYLVANSREVNGPRISSGE